MTIDELKELSIVRYLSQQNIKCIKQYRDTYWYRSPLHEESTPSFKVNAGINLWYDFGLGQGGNIITLVQLLFPSKSMHEVLCYLEEMVGGQVIEVFHIPTTSPANRRETMDKDNTLIKEIRPLDNRYLLDYIDSRRINIDIAKKYCHEIYYTANGYKSYYAIAFMNIDGGMESRNKYSKRCIGGKNISLIQHERERKACCVFEGFFDFLSYKTAALNQDTWLCVEEECDYLILNSVTMTDKAVPYLSRYERIYCYLDNDVAGKTATNILWDFLGNKMKDQSHLYSKFNDVNDFLTSNEKGKSDGTDRVE